MGLRLTFEEKERARDNKIILFDRQDGKCFYYDECGVDFVRENIYPEAAHIIIDSVVNINKYDRRLFLHIDNFRLTCKECNIKAIITCPESQTGIDHINKIMESIENE